MPMHEHFSGLFAPSTGGGVAGVSGVCASETHKQSKALAGQPAGNTAHAACVAGVSYAASAAMETPGNTCVQAKGVSINPEEIQSVSDAKTPETPETPFPDINADECAAEFVSEWREMFNERAGIAEYGGHLPRYEAELQSYRDTFVEFVTACYPDIRKEFDGMIAPDTL